MPVATRYATNDHSPPSSTRSRAVSALSSSRDLQRRAADVGFLMVHPCGGPALRGHASDTFVGEGQHFTATYFSPQVLKDSEQFEVPDNRISGDSCWVAGARIRRSLCRW